MSIVQSIVILALALSSASSLTLKLSHLNSTSTDNPVNATSNSTEINGSSNSSGNSVVAPSVVVAPVPVADPALPTTIVQPAEWNTQSQPTPTPAPQPVAVTTVTNATANTPLNNTSPATTSRTTVTTVTTISQFSNQTSGSTAPVPTTNVSIQWPSNTTKMTPPEPTRILPNPEKDLNATGLACLQKCKDLEGISCKKWKDDGITCCQFTGCQWPFFCHPQKRLMVPGCNNKP